MQNQKIFTFLFVFMAMLFNACSGGTVRVNDIHSRLNETEVQEIVYPETSKEVATIVQKAKLQGNSISISGSRHAMGGQQFGSGTIHLSTKKLQKILHLDSKRGIVRVQSGVEWPELIDFLVREQKGAQKQWSIVQKQTGGDRLSIGGALSANAHGRGVRFKPFIQDVEAFTLVNAEGEILTVSRGEHADLFRLVIGGYGLFGVITEVELRLQPRVKLERVVEVISLDELPTKTVERLNSGFMYGDFQYKTDEQAIDFMKTGVFSAYRPVDDMKSVSQEQKKLSPSDWNALLVLAHTNKAKAFEKYSQYYLTTNGQRYWSDTHQLSYYNPDYAEILHRTFPAYPKSSLMISELYVPRVRLTEFMNSVEKDARKRSMDIVYGTLRLIEKDDESFLPWAKQDYACVIFNLEVEHDKKGLAKAETDFQLLIDRALSLGGSFFLTYHRWARKDQILQAYPQFPEFLAFKRKYDPEERFQSDWYRHYAKMFQKEIESVMREGAYP